MGQSETDQEFERRLSLVNEAIDKYHVYLVSYVANICKNYQSAEDIMQEVWVFVLNKFEESKITCLPILRRKAWQKSIDHYRSLKRRKETTHEELPDVPVSPAHNSEPQCEEEEKEFERSFWSEFPGIDLTEGQKKVLWFHARYGLSYKEIEAKTGIATSTIGDWIKLARSKVAAYLNSQM